MQVSGAQDIAGNLQISATIADRFSINTASTIEFAAASFSALETSITSNAVTLIRIGDTSDSATVQIDIIGGSATGINTAGTNSDYIDSIFPLIVRFAPTETRKTIEIPISDDRLVEGEETIALGITDSNNAMIGNQTTATLTIADNETAGFTLDQTTLTVSETGSPEIFTITLDAEPSSDVVLNITNSDPSEVIVAPVNVTLTPTNWDTGVAVMLTGEDDQEIDGDIASSITVSVDAENSDDAFDPIASQTLSVTTVDDNQESGMTVEEDSLFLTPIEAIRGLEVTNLATANTVILDIEQVGVDAVSEILIFSIDASGGDRTQIGRFSLLEGNQLSNAYAPQFTVDSSNIEIGEILQFVLVENGETHTALPVSLGQGQVALEFGEGTQLSISLASQISSTNLLRNNASAIDLTELAGESLEFEIVAYRESAFENTLRFYTTDFEDGGIVTDSLTGTTLYPGDIGYEAAAIARQLEVEITGQNNQVESFGTTVEGGGYLGMFLIVNETDPMLRKLYFSHAGANDNQNQRIRMLGSNTFGFEDLPNLGDRDFNDLVVEFAVV